MSSWPQSSKAFRACIYGWKMRERLLQLTFASSSNLH